MLRKALLWLVPLTAVAALLLLLTRTADAPPASGAVVVTATPEVAAPPTPMPEAPPPVLNRVVLDGTHSTARFRLADDSERTVGLNTLLQPGWMLTALDSGSATFVTPSGEQRIALSAPPVVEEKPVARTVLVANAPAVAADGEAVSRCTDPEC